MYTAGVEEANDPIIEGVKYLNALLLGLTLDFVELNRSLKKGKKNEKMWVKKCIFSNMDGTSFFFIDKKL